MNYTDQCGRHLVLQDRPQRIVSLVPSQTELLYDLGLREEVVGITKFCVHPKKWFESKKRIGGTKNLHLEEIQKLAPDLIIANKEENTKEQIQLLSADYPVWISDVNNLADNHEMIRCIGEICGKQKEAERIVKQVESGFSQITKLEPIVSCLYFIWQEPYMLVSSDTFIDDVLHRCGFKNLAHSIGKRYPEISVEEITSLSPEVILLSSEPYPFKEAHKAAFENMFPSSTVLLVNGEMFSWYGSRIRLSGKYLQELNDKIRLLSEGKR